ncbi:RagB/SusD family nutrient uptake outer membrane protein [Pedobacter sp. ISL-68]|uniref:RagB/SusD family nutrient uptake outer membrane protein n=1 Tax=unclassified Pedobacter TaxID=2628915 RepID=UPI001BEA90E0|nr:MULTISPECIES: RagB/SusD family nutrient uptake outer membrane protein [unclassified Pedobacter]MBT2559848.1 RagB/SusD family nutrient uptake outer membrane protein [Pedobacter sp. ISL-64]MBT2592153.1 RagB/SusD family nutrient uptake outer membrane protein [Pedobacter sp. ISL-68]
MKKRILYFTVALLFLHLGACKKFITVGPPSTQIASSSVFQTEETAISAINGLYTTMCNSSLYVSAGGSTVYLGLYADELYTTSTNANAVEFTESKLGIANSFIYNNFWRNLYQVIYQANSCISGLQDSAIAPALRNQLLGEAYFMRAYCYWHLTSLFGDVPLVLTGEDYAGVALMGRTQIAEVKNKIISDLKKAKSLVNKAYPTNGRYRVNYYTVLAMLSRIYTYLGNWDEVLSSSNEVISQGGTYFLEPDLNKVFLIGSNEAIWQTASGGASENTFEGQQMVPLTAATVRPNYPLQAALYNAFSGVDKRKTSWIATKTVSGITYQYPYKYKVGALGTTKVEAQMMIRLAEVFLNRAEAKAHLGDITAIDDLNKIRNRAGLSSLSILNGQALLDAIMVERRFELFVEWGLRWYDLRRTGKLDQVLGSMKSTWTPSAGLFPIPNSEILAAPNLTQNPGYN